MSSDISKKKKASNTTASDIELPEGVEATSDIPDGVSEDVYRFWKENGKQILTYCGIFLILFLGVQGWKQYSASREISIREDFAQLDTIESIVEFANKHKSHSIASFAYLQAAKDAYENEDYVKAAEYYSKAAKGLDESELQGLALLGEASSLRETGDEAAAVSALESIASKEEFAEGIRAEAMFKRIVIALENGENEVVNDYTTMLEAIDNTQIWAQRLESIKYYQ